MSIHELRAKRASTFEAFAALAAKANFVAKTDQSEYDRLKAEVERLDGQIKRADEAQEISRETDVAVPGQERATVPAAAETSPYASDAAAKQMDFGSSKSLILGAAVKMLAAGGGGILNARQISKEVYGEAHPVTKALLASVGASGGFFVPPDYMPDYVEILRAKAQVRAAGPARPADAARHDAPARRRPRLRRRATAPKTEDPGFSAGDRRAGRQLQERGRPRADLERPDALRRPGDRRLRP